jgi:hypothetical protein
VFVGSGKAGFTSVVREGAFSPEVSRLLSQKFVCLYVDTTKASGRTLADAFQLNKGVIISDRTGQSQAFSLAGDVSSAELSKTLVAYADADPKDVKKTETKVTDAKMVIVVQGNYSGGCCGKSYGGGCCGWGCCGKSYSSGCSTGGSCCGWGGGCCGKSYSSGCCGWGGGCCGSSYSSGCSGGYCCK